MARYLRAGSMVIGHHGEVDVNRNAEWSAPADIQIPLDKTIDDAISDLDFSRVFHRLIIGPSQYGSAMEDAFIRELQSAGVKDAHQRVVRSDIPIRSAM